MKMFNSTFYTKCPLKCFTHDIVSCQQPSFFTAKGSKSFYLFLKRQCMQNIIMSLCILYSIVQTNISESLHIAQTEMTRKQFYEHDYIFYLIGYHIIFGQTTYVHLQTQIYVFSPTLASILTIIF